MIHMIWLNLSVKYSNIQWRNDFIIITSLWRHTFWSKYRNFIYFLLQEALCSSKKRGNKSLIIQKWFYSAITIRDPRTAKSGNRPVRIGPISHFLFAMNNNALEYLLLHFLRKSFVWLQIGWTCGQTNPKKEIEKSFQVYSVAKSHFHIFKGPSKWWFHIQKKWHCITSRPFYV